MIFSNNGERCTAGSRILVQQSIYADFAQKFAERARRIAVGDPLDEKTIIGPMISQGHLAKVRSYIELGPKEGATLLCGGLDAPSLPGRVKKGNYVMPTVFADVDNRMRIAQEEIFGPVACLIPFTGRGRRDSPGQRHPVWLVQLRVDREHRPRPSRGRRRRSRHVLRQQPERARPAPAVRRHQGLGHRPRGRHLELRGVPGAEERRGVSGQSPHPALGDIMSNKLVAAVAQTATVLLDTPATVERALGLMADAARRGVQLLVFPEAFIGGYPKGADFHIYLGGRTPQGRAEFKRYFDAAVTVDGPEIAQLAKAAARHKMYVVVGIIERDGGTLYCTAVYLGPDGARPGQAPQADAHGAGAPGLGLRRRLDAAGGGHALRQARRRDLLGELHAGAAHGDVPAARRAVLRADGGRPRQLGVDHAAHRAGGPLLRAVGLPAPAPLAVPRRR